MATFDWCVSDDDQWISYDDDSWSQCLDEWDFSDSLQWVECDDSQWIGYPCTTTEAPPAEDLRRRRDYAPEPTRTPYDEIDDDNDLIEIISIILLMVDQ